MLCFGLLPINGITDSQLLEVERALEMMQPNFLSLHRRQLKPSEGN